MAPRRLLRALIGLTLAGLTLTGCALPSTRPDPDLNLTTADVLYLSEIRHASFDLKTDAASLDVIAAGRDTCESLDKGATVPAVVKPLLQRAYADHASVIIVAAVHSYCPRHAAQLTVPAR